MKKFKIAHLYYDLMNLYGENGNVKCLEKYLTLQDFDVEIHYLSLGDNIDFSNYDLFYIGSGSKESFFLTLENIMKYKKDIKNIIDKKFFIVTGNALNLFGKSYEYNKETFKCLDCLDFTSYEKKKRIVGEKLFTTNLINESVIGFENRSSIIQNNNEQNLFNTNKDIQGVKHNNFYGSYLLGPLLIRNPYFAIYLVKEICKKNNIPYKDISDNISIKAYEEYLKTLKIN